MDVTENLIGGIREDANSYDVGRRTIDIVPPCRDGYPAYQGALVRPEIRADSPLE